MSNSIMHSMKEWLLKPAEPAMYDRQILWIAFALMVSGLVMVSSASISVSIRHFDSSFHYAYRHGIFLVGALLVGTITLTIPVNLWQKYSSALLVVSIILLIAVLIIGRSVNGAVRWLPLGVINLQPAEIAKLSLFVFIAGYLERRHGEVVKTFRGFLKPLMVFFVLAFLLLLQPDLGTVIVMFVAVVGMLFVAGAKLWQFLGLIMMGLGSIVLLIVFEPYRWRRVTSFLDPWQDAFGSGYQLTQSLMAFGRGGWFGQGLGNSVQKLEYLPEAHTDFVFAILGEELGLIGVCFVLLLVFALVAKALIISWRCLQNDMMFSGFLSFGIGIWLAFQTMVNVGAASGMIPTKGLTLPLISYGGSSLLVMAVAVSLLLRIDFEYRLVTTQADPKSNHSKSERSKLKSIDKNSTQNETNSDKEEQIAE
ncbi:cell division protein FtsW [Vibrio sp. SS-MA-C1-2]|uniref:cell division protein FtsW n=1 Tax=Vibrio sp. SS-MA-C1-2 TaxID=2908646 RepID=UPI001F234BC6|nr:cell division protein FtsW [Vibrio sp. SS-MA-C1-2]UJF19608.1 cell division protein FtsW [Vibrio sp. SS-MA-C1-2]